MNSDKGIQSIITQAIIVGTKILKVGDTWIYMASL